MDPGLAKILHLPLFDDGLEILLVELGFTSAELFLAFGPSSEEVFLTKFLNTALAFVPSDPPLLPTDVAVLRKKLTSHSKELGFFWNLIWATKDTLLAREARLQMLGLASSAIARTSTTAPASKIPRLTTPSSTRVLSLRGASTVISPLLEQEIIAKAKWIRRLEAIARSAEGSSKFFNNDESELALTPQEQDKLRKAVLAKGAFRTLAVHVRHFERFMGWAEERSLSFFPLSTAVLLKYALWLHEKGCGPTVIPSVRASISWTCARLGMEVPDFRDQRLLSIEADAVLLRAKELREAVPIPVLAVLLLELFVLRHHLGADRALAFFAGWILCLIYASLRFDDGLHVNPESLLFKGGVLLGVCWQTQVERKRRGSRFAVPEVGFSYQEGSLSWLAAFVELSAAIAANSRDFWMYELDLSPSGAFSLSDKVVTYPRAVKILKICLARSLTEAEADNQVLCRPDQKDEILKAIPMITMHSCKVTMIDAAVHHGEDPLPISMQAHHANTDLVIKYTRNRGDVPLKMLSRLVHDLKGQWLPVPALALPSTATSSTEAEDAFSDDGLTDDLPLFYVKKQKLTETSLFKLKFHVTSANSADQLACNKIALCKCDPVGPDLPDLSLLCKACANARPELFK